MKKRSRKRIICFMLVLSMVFVIPISSSAVQSNSETTNITDISAELSNTLLDTVMQKIQLTAEIDGTCPWSDTTVPDEVIPTYDISDAVNGYIINLETDGNPTGYLMYALSSDGQADLVEFCYEGRYLIEGEPVTASSELGQKTLYFAGPSSFLTKEANDYYIAGTDKKLAVDSIPQVQDSMMQARLTADANLAAPSVQPYGQIVNKNEYVKNLYEPTVFVPKVLNDFPGYDNHCAPLACINMLKYWHERRSIPNLYESGDPTLSLALLRMGSKIGYRNSPDEDGGVPDTIEGYKGVDNGFADYINYYGYTHYSGGGYKQQSNITWSWLTTNINNDHPIFLAATLEGYGYEDRPADVVFYQMHAYLIMGYQETTESNGEHYQYLRVASGYTSSLSRFLNYSWYARTFQYAFYYRWD